MTEKRNTKNIISIILLLIFLVQLPYLMYRIHQVLILGQPIPADIKLSASIAGICLGVLYLLKGYKSPLK